MENRAAKPRCHPPTYVQILTTVFSNFSESEHREIKRREGSKETSPEQRCGFAHQPGLWHPTSV